MQVTVGFLFKNYERRFFMNIFPTRFLGVAIAMTTFCWLSATALAENNKPNIDSNADQSGGFTEIANKVQGVMIRVPINENGEENTNLADLRVFKGLPNELVPVDLESTWNESEPLNGIPQISNQDITKDSSTYGVFRWQGSGWGHPYHYASYRPRFYANGYYWRFGAPRYYDQGLYSGYNGYRYYYYPRYEEISPDYNEYWNYQY